MRSRSVRALVVCALLSLVSSLPSADTDDAAVAAFRRTGRTPASSPIPNRQPGGVPGVSGISRRRDSTGTTGVESADACSPRAVLRRPDVSANQTRRRNTLHDRRRRRVPRWRTRSSALQRFRNRARAAPGPMTVSTTGSVERPRRLQPPRHRRLGGQFGPARARCSSGSAPAAATRTSRRPSSPTRAPGRASATLVTPVNVALPAAADSHQARSIQIPIITDGRRGDATEWHRRRTTSA